MGLTFLAQVVLARWLSTEDYGVYRYVINIESIVVLFAQFGLPQILVRGIAGARAQDDKGAAAAEVFGHVQASRYIFAATGLAALVLGAIAVAVLHGRVSNSLFVGFCMLLVLMPVDIFAQRPSALLRGLKQIGFALLGDNIMVPLGLIVFGGLSWLLGLAGVVPALAAQVLAAASSAAVGSLLLRRQLGPAVAALTPLRTRVRELVRESLPLALAGPLNQIGRYLDVLVLGMFAPMSQVALYAVAGRVATLCSLGLRAAYPITGPLAAERFARGDIAGVERVAFLAAAMATAYSIAFMAILLVAGHLVLSIFGSEYPNALSLLYIISAGNAVSALAGGANQLLIMTQNQRKYVIVLSASVLVNLVLNLALIPRYGAFGAAYAGLIAQLVLCLANAMVLASLLKINASIFNPRLLREIEWSRHGLRDVLQSVFARRVKTAADRPPAAE
jgi:O-antigen/teichoic acid export membrane protein